MAHLALPRWWREDASASVVVFLVALPLCMGVALASGLPPAAGLLTGIVGGVVVGVLSGSPLQVSGPAAGLTVIVWDVVRTHGVSALGPVVLAAGLLQLGAAGLAWGQWFRAIAPPVVYGMLAGIGVLLFGSQFHVMIDDKPRGGGLDNLLGIPSAIGKAIDPALGTQHHLAALLGAITIATIVLWTLLRPARLRAVPAPLIATLVSVAVAVALDAPVRYVTVPDNLGEALHWPTWQSLSRLVEPELALAVVVMAVVASAETLLCAGAVDRMHSHVKTHYDRELAAQGIGNMVCGALGALPLTGVIVRSSANVESGARTRLSAILHGVWLLLLVVALPSVLRVIPTSSLAAILVYTGYKLVSPAQIRELAKFGKTSVAIYAVTVIGIVSTDLLRGVLFGVVLSALRLLFRLSRLSARVVMAPDGACDVHLQGVASFLGLPKLHRILAALPPSVEIHVHLENLAHIDHAAIVVLGDWEKEQRRAGRSVALEWEVLERSSEQRRPKSWPRRAPPGGSGQAIGGANAA